MVCSQCGNTVADGSTVCPQCGAQLSAASATPPPGVGSPLAPPPAPGPAVVPPGSGGGGPRPTGSLPPFSFDAKRWSQAERITAVATLVLFICLFLPWFGVNFGFGSVTVNGLWHGWMYLVLILSLAIMVYLLARAGFSEMPFKLPMAGEQLLLIGTGVNAVLTVLAFLFKPGGSAVGWRFGAFVGLIAALVAAGPLAVPAFQARRAGK